MTTPTHCLRLLPGLALLMLALPTSGALAASDTALDACVDLAPQHEIVRSGGSSHLLLKSGDAHYKVAFRGSCGSLPTASRVSIATDGQAGRLCPAGSSVVTPREQCQVGSVTPIEAEDFQRQKRRRR